MKKKILVIALIAVLALVPASLFAQSGDNWDSIYTPGDLALSASVGYAFLYGLTLYPGAELMLAGIKLGDTVPVDFGVAARGQVGFYNYFGYYGWTTFGLGAFGTAHVSFNNMSGNRPTWLENFDFYVSLGLALNYVAYTGDYAYYLVNEDTLRIGFASVEGVNWFLSDTFALKLEYAYWGWYGSQATIGVLLKL